VTDLPLYHELPIDPTRPAHSAWGVFGDDDEVGTINLLTPERARRARGLVHRGAVFSLNWELDQPSPAFLGRTALQHSVIDLNVGTEDRYDGFYPQASSQWDALCHVCHPQHGFYNGVERSEITGRRGSKLGIDAWARRGIVGRFVLIDVARHREAMGTPLDAATRVAVEVDELEAALVHQNVDVEDGDILLLRFGWIDWYQRQGAEVRARLPELDLFPAPGLHQAEATAAWLWDHRIAAVAADCPALEAMPMDETSEEGYLHYRLIPLLGFAIGELFQLDDLADDCAADGVWEGMLTSAPLNKLGGSGSTANALAIK
jgi:kynurenine formamidase